MASKDPRARQAAARIAALSRSRTPNDPALLDARRDLREARLAEYIVRTVDHAPALTIAQLERLGTLLRPSAGGDGDAA